MDNQQGPTVQPMELCSVLRASLDGCVWGWGWVGENGSMYMYGWVSLLFTWNYHNIVNRLYRNTKWKVWKKKWVELGLEGPSETKKMFSFPLTTSSRQRSCLDLSRLGKNGQGELKEMDGHVAVALWMLNPDPRWPRCRAVSAQSPLKRVHLLWAHRAKMRSGSVKASAIHRRAQLAGLTATV